MSRPFLRWAPPGAWASLILVATSVPISDALAALPPTGTDKLVHLAMYAVLAWLVSRAVATRSLGAALAVLAVVSLFGAADEWHQRFIPGRSSDPVDWVSDSIGAAVGVLAFQTARRRRESVS